MKFLPIEASEKIVEKYKRYLKTIFQIADPVYATQFEKELNKKDIFAKGPYLDAVDSFKKGKSLNQLINEGILPDSFRNYIFAMDRTLYQHQESAIYKAKQGKNLVVSTGTGSGKTESFLIPILSELAEEDEQGSLCPGVRALIIYPMNALANDQMERLRKILSCYPAITYGSYTGQTKKDKKSALQQYRALNNQRDPKQNELICRDDMIAAPPHILITNYAMLEYLMIRPTESTFFSGKYAQHWKYIVLDEAHVYNGSTGIEVSMLLRRLKSSLPVKSIQYILTSATLGSEDQNEEVAEFASRLCDSDFHEADVIRSVRENPQMASKKLVSRQLVEYRKLSEAILNEAEEQIKEEILKLNGNSKVIDTKSAVYDLVLEDNNYWNVRSLLQRNPQTVYKMAETLECSPRDLENFVTVAAYAYKNETMLLDAKYHMFIRASDSAFITLGNSKRLMLTRNKQIFDQGKEYAVFEFGICTFCHAIYLLGKITSTGYFIQRSVTDGIQTQEILYLGNHISDEDEEHSLKSENINVEEMRLCARCGKLMSKMASANERCEHTVDEYIPVYRVSKTKKELTKCVACENINSMGIIRQFFAGQEAVTSVLGTALFEALPSYKVTHEKIEYEVDDFVFDDDDNEEIYNEIKEECAKQFIAFSDSRQAAAFYASYLEKTYTTILYKRLIVEALREQEFLGNINQFVGVLQAQFEKYHVLKDEGMSSEKEAWKAVLNELVDGYSANALQNLGFYELTVDRNNIPGMKKMGLTSQDVSEIVNVCLQSMMRDAAISYSVPLNKTDKEFFVYNGHEGEYTLSDSGKKKYHSFIPTRANGLNKRVEYVEKILSVVCPGASRKDARKFLESLWKLLIKNEIIVSEGVTYKVNTKKIQINSKAKFYQCESCKKITTYNVHNICPSYKCSGKLVEIDLSETLKDNHYYRMYQDMEIRNLRVVEHTAQLSKEKAYEYQNEFKEKKIDVLSCSTTFEMGVDVGDLETVFMRNMPPSPANYAQRAGRAGRSIKSVAYALTFCNKSSHDFVYYNNPEAMIRGNIRPPVFKVENEKIAIRHVFASAFGFFWRKFPQYFSNVEALIEKKDGESGIDRLEDYLQNKPENLKNYLKDFLPEPLVSSFDIEHFGWIFRLLNDSSDHKGVLTRAALEYSHELSILEKTLEEALNTNSRVDYLRWRINNYKKEGIISFLSKKSVLPKYGFPVDTVELSIWDAQNKNKYNLDLQRDMSVAISEYAPGSQIVADGNLITSEYIKKMPNMDWRQFDYIYCDECKTLNIGMHTELKCAEELKKCRGCGKDLDKKSVQTFLIPEFGFEAGMITKAGLVKPKRTYNSEVAYIGYRNDITYEQYLKGNRMYELAYSQNDEMAVLNRSNFYVCANCGYTHLANKGVGHIYPKMHYKSTGAKCNNENLCKYALGYRFDTDVMQIRFCWPALTNYDQALSVMYAIMRGTCSYLNIEESDIAGCLQYFNNNRTSGGSFTIVLYDRTPGGSGHVKSMRNDSVFEAIMSEARNMVEQCNCGGAQADTSCYNCLRSYSNQRVHDNLQRRYVLEFMDDFFNDSLSVAERYIVLPTEWDKDNVKTNKKETIEFKEQFKELLDHADSAIDEKRRFIGLMKDVLYEYPKQMNLMITLYQMDIHKELRTISDINDIFIHRYVKRLENERGISEENAIWATRMWCDVYGRKILRK